MIIILWLCKFLTLGETECGDNIGSLCYSYNFSGSLTVFQNKILPSINIQKKKKRKKELITTKEDGTVVNKQGFLTSF